jgi:hypothetical protein
MIKKFEIRNQKFEILGAQARDYSNFGGALFTRGSRDLPHSNF